MGPGAGRERAPTWRSLAVQAHVKIQDWPLGATWPRVSENNASWTQMQALSARKTWKGTTVIYHMSDYERKKENGGYNKTKKRISHILLRLLDLSKMSRTLVETESVGNYQNLNA